MRSGVMVIWDNCTDDTVSFEKNIPVVVVLAVFVVTGTMGNSLVLFIYGFRFKTSTTRVFILSLAIFDFITCVTLPYKMVLLRYSDLYNQQAYQRAEVVRLYFIQVSMMLLPLVSIDRHRRICMPHKRQITPRIAKCMVLALCVVMATITTFRMAVSKYHTCYRAEAYISPEFVSEHLEVGLRIFYFVYMILPYVIPLPILIISYAFIGIRVRQLKGNSASKTSSPRTSNRSEILLNLLSRRPGMSGGGTENKGGKPGEEASEQRISSNEVFDDNPPAMPISSCNNEDSNLGTVANPSGTSSTGSQHVQRKSSSRTSLTLSLKAISLCGELEETIIASSQYSQSEDPGFRYSQIVNSDYGLANLASVEGSAIHSPTDTLESEVTCTGNDLHETNLHGAMGRTDARENGPGGVEQIVHKRRALDPKLRLRRTTLIFFLITLVYVASCIPFLTIYIIFRVNYSVGHTMLSNGGFIVFYNLVYIPVVSNCFLYGFFDPRFRKELQAVRAALCQRSSKLCRLDRLSVWVHNPRTFS